MLHIRLNIHGAVADNQHLAGLIHLEYRGLAEQLAGFQQAGVLVQNPMHEGGGLHQALHGDVCRATAHHGDRLVNGSPLVSFVDNFKRGRLLPKAPQQGFDFSSFADEHRIGNPFVHGHQHGLQSDVVVGAGHCDFLAARMAPDKGFHLLKRGDSHSSNTSSLPVSA